MDKQKCAIIGCGAVGATIAFALTQKSLFSELVLIDANKARACLLYTSDAADEL